MSTSPQPKPSWIHWLALLTLSCLYASGFIATKICLQFVKPNDLLLARFFVPVALTLPVSSYRLYRIARSIAPYTLLKAIPIGFALIFCTTFALFETTPTLPVSFLSSTWATIPIWSLVFSRYLMLIPRISSKKLLSLTLALLGVFSVSDPHKTVFSFFSSDHRTFLLAEAFLLLSVIFASAAGPLQQLYLKNVPSSVKFSIYAATGYTCTLLYVRIHEPQASVWNAWNIPLDNHPYWLCFFVVTVLVGTFSWAGMVKLIDALGASFTFLLCMITPALSCLGSVLFLNEPLHTHETIGMVLIAFGLFNIATEKTTNPHLPNPRT